MENAQSTCCVQCECRNHVGSWINDLFQSNLLFLFATNQGNHFVVILIGIM
jgi:hypothetical protein